MDRTIESNPPGVPAIKVTDGPNGTRSDGVRGRSAASFPVGAALGSTWNPDLVRAVGESIGQEALTKGANVVLGPTINLHRTPLGGRNFECYGEDPWLLTAATSNHGCRSATACTMPASVGRTCT